MKNYQTGSTLLEGLISIAIFSFGVLGTLSFQANMIAQSTQSASRMIASMHINNVIGAASADSANYRCYVYKNNVYDNSAPCANAKAFMETWVANVQMLEGATTNPPVVEVIADNLTVTVNWKLPSADAAVAPFTMTAVTRPINNE